MSRPIPRRALMHATATPWAILPSALEAILAIAALENLTPDAVAAQLGRPLDNTRTVTVRDGVATIPIEGPLFRRDSFVTQFFGFVSYEQIALDLTAAVNDGKVRAILLAIDSPGGEVAGVSDLARMIRAATGVKPVVAHVDGVGASAALWLAVAADEVVVSDAALVGSIGVVATFTDRREADARSGIQHLEIVSSQTPGKRADPATEEGRARLQATIDALAEVFIADVAAFRGVTPERVIADFGGGDVLVGRAAVLAGLVDRVGTQESAHAALSSHSSAGALRPVRTALTQEIAMPATLASGSTTSTGANSVTLTVEPVAPVAAAVPAPTTPDADPAPVDTLAAAIDAERARVTALLDLPTVGHEAMIRDAIRSGASVGDVSHAILAAEHAQRQAHLAALRQTETELAPPSPAPSESGETSAPSARVRGQQIAARFHQLTTRS